MTPCIRPVPRLAAGLATRLATILISLGALAACGDPGINLPPADDLPPPATDSGLAPIDLRAADLGPCGGPCAAPTPYCDPGSGRCVACRADGDCPIGSLCRAGSCVPGCGGQRGCGDAGTCETDAGTCVECLSDNDCRRFGDPARRACNPRSSRCVACHESPDDCPAGSWCRADGQGGAACAPGCQGDFDCRGADGGAMTTACCAHACVDTASSNAHCGGCGFSCGGAPDANCCASRCVRTGSDVNSCGGCGRVCRFANAASLCAAGNCQLGACDAGFADCDMNPASGCETSVASDLSNCGACGKACAVAHATPACIGGACAIAACDNGYRNCNGLPIDGCEINSGADPKNCGQCGNDCGQLPHAVASCLGGACVVGQCAPGFGDCNKVDADGCERPLDGDPANCGACGKLCPAPANMVANCAMSLCGVGGCKVGFGDCDKNLGNGCEASFATDPAHCGACGMACAPNSTCVAGMCSALFGSGKAGPLSIKVDTVFAGYAETHLAAAAVAKATTMTVVDASGMAAGDRLLIVNVRSAIGNDGAWEIADLASLKGNTLQLGAGLAAGYPEPANTVVRTMPQYTDVNIAIGATLSARPWTPNTLGGGIIALTASGSVTVDGKLWASGAGYLGGVGNANDPNVFVWKAQGESYLGLGLSDLPNNVANAGGGAGGSKRGFCSGAGGGGGGYGTAGAKGGDNNYACGAIQVGGVGGASYGDVKLTRIYFGSGGGSGGYTLDPLLGAGGNGGGMIVVLSPKVTVTGSIEARGADGTIEFKIYGGGGGGAGGSIYLRTQQAINDPSKVQAGGGAGGGLTMGGTQVGGAGGVGRVFLDARP